MAVVVTTVPRPGASPTCQPSVNGNAEGFCFPDLVRTTITKEPGGDDGRQTTNSLLPPGQTIIVSTPPAATTNLAQNPEVSTAIPSSANQGQSPGVSPAIPTSTTSPIPNVRSSNHKSGVSGGVVAGVAIACLIAGAVLAALGLFLLYRRRSSRQPEIHGQQHLPPSVPHHSEKSAIVTATPVGRRGTSNVDHILPPPAEDAAIIQPLSKLRDNIKNHSRTYYHTEPVPATAMNESLVSELASWTGLRSSALLGMFVNPATRHAAIRLYIGWIATTRCSEQRYPSFLPDEISQLTVNMPGRDGKNKDQIALLSKWKAITGTLLQQRFGGTINEADSRTIRITEAINQIDAALAPFVARDVDKGHRHRNLEMIMGRAAQLAFLIFSQPGSFRFDLGNPGARNSLVVFPALLQTVDDQGHLLSSPRLLCEKEDVGI